jgi:hypothetical protein
MTVADGLSETTDMGPVAGPQQFEDIRKRFGRRNRRRRLIAGRCRRPRRLLYSPHSLHRRHDGYAGVSR